MYLSRSRLVIPILVASLVGVGTGFVVVGFIRFIEICRGFFFGELKDWLSIFGVFAIILIPAIGGVFVGPLVTYFAPEAKGHGVPEVMKAIALQGGRIRPIVVVIKALASALAIGSGASVGREGPIVQAGSALGSTAGQLFKLSETKIKNLVACGAAAGISGVFNTPIAGVMFALEVILRDFGARALSTVVVASVAASIVSRIFLGDNPAFVAPVYSLWSPFEILIYLFLGVLSAFVALSFIYTLHGSERLFESLKFPEWLKPVLGGLGVGIIGLYFPQVFGAGLDFIENALHGNLSFMILLSLVLMKVLATSLSLGSGSSGGVFAPALFIGAALGGTIGKLFYGRMPFLVAPPGAYALVGMASVFAGAAHAPVTAILIVFEMTGDYRMILPIMVAVVVSTSISQLISRESIYTIKLKDRGIDIGPLEEVKILGAIQVRDAMTHDYEILPKKLPAKELIKKMSHQEQKTFFVAGIQGNIVGYIKPEEVQELLLEKDLSVIVTDDVAVPLPETCFPDEPLSEVARLMTDHKVTRLPVMDPSDPSKIVGILKHDDVLRAYMRATIHRDELVGRMEHQTESANGTVTVRFTIPQRSSLAGKLIRDLDLPDGIVLTSIERKNTTHVPEGGTVLMGRDKIWAVVHPKSEQDFRKWLLEKKLKRFFFPRM
ncbi:MAG: chloride channel protein [Candidatus Omnitrophica bacterium]|nr:chloride channel protein [Candidatus Omnitrophota bacterium]